MEWALVQRRDDGLKTRLRQSIPRMNEMGRDSESGWFNRPPQQDARVIWLILFRLRWALLAMLVLAVAATVGYVTIAGYGWFDAVYMTVITIGTVGYGETRPLGTAGRVLTIGVIIAGFTTFVYAVSVLTNLFVSGDTMAQIHHRRTMKMREGLDHHVIVVGFGRVGQAVVRGLEEAGKPCVVLDRNPAAEEAIRAAGGVEVIGDATSPEDLRKAGIERADALIAACDTDAENLVVVLTAHSTQPDLRIVSRVNQAAWLGRLKQAGADVAQSPYPSYGRSLAAAAASVSPSETALHELPFLGLGTQVIPLRENSPLIGLTAAEVLQGHQCVHAVGLRRDGASHDWHAVEGAVQLGDVIVALGSEDDVAALASAASSAMAGIDGEADRSRS